jgi:hypothetical protein
MEATQIGEGTFVRFREGYVPSLRALETYEAPSFLRQAAPPYYSEAMIGGEIHSCDCFQLLAGKSMACFTVINLTDRKGQMITYNPGFSPARTRRMVRGIRLDSKLALVERDTPHLPLPFSPNENRQFIAGPHYTAFSRVGDAMLKGITVADAGKSESATDYSCTAIPYLGVRIFNPTQTRLAEASAPFRHFAEFMSEHAKEVLDAAELVYCASRLDDVARELLSQRPKKGGCKEERRHILQSAADLEARADEIIARMHPPDTGLQKYVMN